jgi:molybdopterin molybdotransferase
MRQPDRCAEPPSQRLTLDRALELMLGLLRPIAGRERLPLKHARGRILAEEIRAPLDLPPFANSAMDGYAIRAGAPDSRFPLRVAGTSWAGRPFTKPLAGGECVRIFTGAPLPEGADAVVPQEDARREGDTIRITTVVKPGDCVRLKGDDFRAGQVLLPAGKRLAPADLGLLAAGGMYEATVRRRPRVAFFSTGDELRPVWQPLGSGDIHESNRYVLDALLTELGVEALDFGTVPDDPGALKQAMLEASDLADAVITTGGASVGEADFVIDVLRTIGRIEFWKVALKPGKPFAFGRIGSAWFFGLPGNPAAIMVTFRQLVRPGLLRLMGAPASAPLRLRAVCANRLDKSPGRLEFQRGVFRRTPGGDFSVEGLSGQGSHRLGSMSRANCFIILPEENSGANPGDIVEIEPFDEPC